MYDLEDFKGLSFQGSVKRMLLDGLTDLNGRVYDNTVDLAEHLVYTLAKQGTVFLSDVVCVGFVQKYLTEMYFIFKVLDEETAVFGEYNLRFFSRFVEDTRDFIEAYLTELFTQILYNLGVGIDYEDVSVDDELLHTVSKEFTQARFDGIFSLK